MALFASTLYPQTNPTNSFLLAFRDECQEFDSVPQAAQTWLAYWTDVTLWAKNFLLASPEAVEHTRRVLTRLAALSG